MHIVGGHQRHVIFFRQGGNVHKLVQKQNSDNVVHIVPIVDKQGNLAWPERDTLVEVERMKRDDDDFAGERLCEPAASLDVLFDRESCKEWKI